MSEFLKSNSFLNLDIKKIFYVSIIFSLVIYVIIIILFYFFQRSFIYLPNVKNSSGYQSDNVNFFYKEVKIINDDKINLIAWLHEKDLQKKKTLIFFHGNSGELHHRKNKLYEFSKLDINFIIFAWRGYSGNKGSPTEQGLYQDANSVIKWIQNKGVKEENIILYGESLGTGVAIEVGQNKNFSGIILEAPYTSLVDLAKKYYPFLPVDLLLQDKFESIKKIKNLKSPVLVLHGGADEIVPFHMGKKIFDEIKTKKYGYFPEFDHHKMNFDSKLTIELEKFIKL